jgi:hypothetical protein
MLRLLLLLVLLSLQTACALKPASFLQLRRGLYSSRLVPLQMVDNIPMAPHSIVTMWNGQLCCSQCGQRKNFTTSCEPAAAQLAAGHALEMAKLAATSNDKMAELAAKRNDLKFELSVKAFVTLVVFVTVVLLTNVAGKWVDNVARELISAIRGKVYRWTSAVLPVATAAAGYVLGKLNGIQEFVNKLLHLAKK